MEFGSIYISLLWSEEVDLRVSGAINISLLLERSITPGPRTGGKQSGHGPALKKRSLSSTDGKLLVYLVSKESL